MVTTTPTPSAVQSALDWSTPATKAGSTNLNTPTIAPAKTPVTPITSNPTALTPGQFNTAPAPSKPTPVVSSTGAANTASNIKTNIITPAINAQTQKSQALYDTSSGFVTPYGLSQGAKPVQPNDPAMAKTGTTSTNTSPTSTTSSTTSTDPLAAEQLRLTQFPNTTQLWNLSNGQQENVPDSKITNGTAPGYSTNNPTTLGATATVAGSNGETYKQFPDGTYGMFDASGNYVTAANSAQFNAAKATQDAQTALTNIRNGIYSPTQQAQLDSITAQYKTLLDKQGVINANTTGATTVAENMYGLGNQTIGQQQISKTITDGTSAIAALTSQRDSAINQMKSAFETDDMNALKSAYDIYNTSSQNIQKELDKVQTAIQTAKTKQEVSDQNFATTMAGKYPDAGIDPYNDDKNTVTQKLQDSPLYKAVQKSKLGAVDQDVLDGMLKLYNKTGAIPTFQGAAGLPLKTAFYAALGGNSSLVDDATANKAAVGAATKALNTQQTQYSATQTSIGTLKSSMGRLDTYIKPLVDSGSPLLNSPLRSLSGKVLGSENYSAFQNEMNTIATEYAKILNGASASISGVSVSSVDDIKKAFNESVTTGQLETVLDAMKQDVNARLVSQKTTINQLTGDIHDLGSTNSTSSSTNSSSTTGTSTSTGGWSSLGD